MPKVSEAHVEHTCTAMLELDGWRALKTDPVSRREWGKGFGEKGMADCLYIRYHPEAIRLHSRTLCETAAAEVLWVEWKTMRGEKATKLAGHQVDWHTLERKRGALTLKAGVDFPATIEGFKRFYETSGLMRNWYLSSGLNRSMLP